MATDSEAEERIQRALQEVFDLCSGKRRWTMRVPPEDTDSDLVILAGLDAASCRDAEARVLVLNEGERITLASILEQWIEDNYDEEDVDTTHEAAEIRKRLLELTR